MKLYTKFVLLSTLGSILLLNRSNEIYSLKKNVLCQVIVKEENR